MKKIFAIALMACAFTSSISSAQSAVLTSTPCLTASVDGAMACQGIYDGNDSDAFVENFFGNSVGWDFLLKLDASSGTETAITGESLTVNTDSTWSISGIGAGTGLMFILKGGPTFSAFKMNTGVTGGSFDMLSALKGNGKPGPDLSHWSVYTTPISAVPLPASGLLLGTLILGGAAMARRRKVA
jgi:hypothetical protein